MANTILLIFEGEETEVQIYESLNKSFFSEETNTIIHAAYKGEIYQLFDKLKDDPFLDLVGLLKERTSDSLQNVERKDVSEMIPEYLVFRAHSQSVIFSKQQEIFIKPYGKISVLSGFPFFVLEYFGEVLFDRMLNPDDN